MKMDVSGARSGWAIPVFTAAMSAGLVGLVLAGCTSGGAADGDTGTDGPTVVVSIYPLEFIAESIAGEHATVLNVVPVGAEPHDIELSPRDVFTMDAAEITVTVSGFQPAVDAAAAEIPAALDLAPDLDLQERGGALDPHFWLDPGRMQIAATLIADALVEADPAQEETYRNRERAVREELRDLDDAFRTGMADCEYDSFVTGHAAFGYLADAYELNEIAVAGIDPDTEPSPAAVAATRQEIRSLGLPMVYAEPGETKVAEVLAEELGIGVGTLDPVEAVRPPDDYLTLMHANLDALKDGLQCH